MCVYTRIYISCIYIDMYIYTYTYIHTHIYSCFHPETYQESFKKIEHHFLHIGLKLTIWVVMHSSRIWAKAAEISQRKLRCGRLLSFFGCLYLHLYSCKTSCLRLRLVIRFGHSFAFSYKLRTNEKRLNIHCLFQMVFLVWFRRPMISYDLCHALFYVNMCSQCHRRRPWAFDPEHCASCLSS